MKVILCLITAICSSCYVVGIKVQDSTQEEQIMADKSSSDLHKSATNFVFNKAQNKFRDSSSTGTKLGRYSPRIQNSRLNILGSQISEGPDLNYPIIYKTGNFHGGAADYHFKGPAIYETDDFEDGDESLGFNENVVNFPKGLSRGSLSVTRKDINLENLGSGFGTTTLGTSGARSFQPKDRLDDDTDLELDTPKLIHSEDVGHDEIIGVSGEKVFKKGSHAHFKADHKAASGIEDAKGYENAESFDKGEKGKIQNGKHAEHYDGSAGSKKAAEIENKNYADSESGAKGEKSESYDTSEGHKKGHKTTGYHNVYHKDEYKKDTSFYDDEHESHQEEAHGLEDSRHAEVEGAHERNDNVDSSYHQDHQNKKGFFTNAHQYGAARGHDRKEGDNEAYEKGAEYSKETRERAASSKSHVE